MVDIKDFVYDKFGILDDAQDFSDRLNKLKQEFATKARVAKNLLVEIESIVSTAASPEELRRANTKQALGVVKDLRDEMRAVLKDANQLQRKAGKEPKIAKQISGPLRAAMDSMVEVVRKMDETMRQIVVLEREQKDVLKEMERQADRSAGRRKKSLASRIGKLAGIVTAAAAVVGTIALIATK